MTLEERLAILEMQVKHLHETDELRATTERLRDLGLDQAASTAEKFAKVLPKLEDGMTVLTRAQNLHADSIKEHKEWLGELTLAQARLTASQESLAESQKKTEAQFRETDKRLRELGEATDKRIADLVSAIGEFMNRGRNGGQKP